MFISNSKDYWQTNHLLGGDTIAMDIYIYIIFEITLPTQIYMQTANRIIAKVI